MIHGPVQYSKHILEIIRDSNLDFHLTGSRFFGHASSASDWDFLLANSLQSRDFLTTNEFEEHDSAYNDRTIVSVWAKDNVHVQLIEPTQMAKKLKVQTAIQCHVHTWESYSKDFQRQIWNLALSLASNYPDSDYPNPIQ